MGMDPKGAPYTTIGNPIEMWGHLMGSRPQMGTLWPYRKPH